MDFKPKNNVQLNAPFSFEERLFRVKGMYVYEFPSRKEKDVDASVIHRHIRENFKNPTGVTVYPDKIIVSFNAELSASEKETLDNVMAMTIKPTEDELYQKYEREFAQITWAVIDSVDITNKTVVVKRTIGDRTFYRKCMFSYTLLQAYNKGELNVGDIVLIAFKPNDLTKAVVFDKVVT